MFFLRRTQPLALGAGQLRALRLSLNTPVVATSDLPVGPARAAIVVHDESAVGLALTVGVRSMNTGVVVLYGLEGRIAPEACGEGVDAALAFAEGMGFLFDDELIDGTPDAADKALARWCEAMGDGAETIVPSEGESASAPLELFDLGGGDLTDPPVEAAPAAPDTGGFDLSAVEEQALEPEAKRIPLNFELDPEPVPTPPLTKFRAQTDQAPTREAPEPTQAPKPRPRRQALGRLRLERRRVSPEVQDVRRVWLLRLLTSF